MSNENVFGPVESTMPKISNPTPKKSFKNRSPNNSNRDKIFCLLLEEFESLYGIELIKENFRKMIFSKYEKLVSDYDFSSIKDEGIIRLRIRDILAPLIRLDTSLCRMHDGDKLKDMLDLMFGLPFSVKTICEEFDEHDTPQKKSLDRYIRRLAKKIEKSGIFISAWIYDEEYGIKKNTKLDNTQFWWIPFYHTTDDLWEHVLSYYKTLADKRGKPIENKLKESKAKKLDTTVCYYCKKPVFKGQFGRIRRIEEDGEVEEIICHKECLP